MATNVQIYQAPPFKGLNETPNIQEGESPYCIGVYSDLGAIKKQSGYVKKYTKNFSNAIQGIYEYIKSSLEKWLIVVADNKVWKKALADTDFSQLEITEDTLLSCSGNKIYKHRGISSEIDSYFEVSDVPTPNFTGLTVASGNLISCDDAGDKIRVHSGISATISSSFASPASDPSGLYYDGTDLWSCDKGTSKIYHHSGISATITESFDSPGIAPTGLFCDNAKNLISGNYERYGRFIDLVSGNWGRNPQLQVVNDKIYMVFERDIGTPTSYSQIFTATVNIDGIEWSEYQRTSIDDSHRDPQLQVVNDKIYYVYRRYLNICTATMNIDGTGWSAVDHSANIPHFPQLQVVNNKIYYVWTDSDASGEQIYTATMNIDGTGWSAVKRTSETGYRKHPQLQVVNNKIYYVWGKGTEDYGSNYVVYQIYTATMNIDGTGWISILQRDNAYYKLRPQLQVVDDKIYYMWAEKDDTNFYQIYTATMNIDGTGWIVTRRTTSLYNKTDVQLQVVDDKIYYMWTEDDGTNDYLYTATMNINGTGWSAVQRVLQQSGFPYPQPSQFQVVKDTNMIYYFYDKETPTPAKLFIAKIYLGTIFVHKQKSSLIDRSYITSDNVDDIYFDGTNLISCDKTAKKITIYDGISNTIKNSFTISYEPYGLSFASIVKTSSLQVDKCDFATLNDTLVISTGKKWLLRWTGSGNLISTVPTTSFQQFPVIKYCKVFKNVAIGVDINNPSRLKWCFWNMPDTWYDSSYIDIDKDNGEVIKGLSLFRDDLIVFKENYLYKISYTGDAEIPFIYDKIDNIGTIGHKTIVLVEGLLYFIAKDGIYVFDGVLSKKISLSIPNIFGKFLSQHYDKIVVIDMKPLHQIFWTIPEPEVSGDATILIYDYLLNCFWTSCQKETDYFNYFEFVSNEYLAGGAKSANAYIYKLNEGDTADDSAYLAGIFHSKRLDFGLPNKWKQIRKIFLDVKASGDYNLGVATNVDDKGWSTEKTISLLSSQERMTKELLYNLIGKSIKFKFRNSNANQPFIIYYWGVEYQVLPWER